MAVEVIMPALGVAQDTGLLVTWYRAEGDLVSEGEPLLLIETDKATLELESPGSGTLVRVTAAEGDSVPVGTAIAFIVADGEQVGTPAEPLESASTAAQPQPSVPTPSPAPTVLVPSGGLAQASAARGAASPKVRRLAAERGIDLAGITGSGPGGVILAGDLDSATTVNASPSDGESHPRRKAIWNAMARNVTASWREVPHFYLNRAVSATALLAAQSAIGPPTTITDLLVAAVAGTLGSHPLMNAGRPEINVGLATASDDGLFVAVIKGADKLNLAEITAQRIEVLGRVRAGRHTADDLADPSFTISNLGMHGVDSFHAVVSAGQAGILAVGRIQDRVIARDAGFAIAPIMSMSLSCDHRLIDGTQAAGFLSALAEVIESSPAQAP